MEMYALIQGIWYEVDRDGTEKVMFIDKDAKHPGICPVEYDLVGTDEGHGHPLVARPLEGKYVVSACGAKYSRAGYASAEDAIEAMIKYALAQETPPAPDPHAPGAKLDAGKPQADLLLSFGNALMAVAEVATSGAEKYSRDGWLGVPDGENRYTAALVRHLLATKVDGPAYEEHGVTWDHDAQVAWNALARLELKLRAAKGVQNGA